MKKLLLIFAILISNLAANAQNQKDTLINPYENKNEVKLNLPLLAFGMFETSYERHLNENNSLGITLHTLFDHENPDQDLNYYISPYYRRYFGKKYGSGFFAEGFSILSSIDGKKITDIEGNLTDKKGPEVFDLSLGLGLGSKWVTKSGFVFEVHAGLGKQLFNYEKTDHDQIVKFGINFGYRF